MSIAHAAHFSINGNIQLVLVGDDATGDVDLEICPDDGSNGAPDRDLAAHVLDALSDRPRTRTDLRAKLRVQDQRLGTVLEELRDAGRIQHDARVWLTVPVPAG